jgi:hypothetical protein
MTRMGPEVSSRDPLVGFLYVLMRDHLTPGTVEGILMEHVERAAEKERVFSNGWLAEHAKDVAGRLAGFPQ